MGPLALVLVFEEVLALTEAFRKARRSSLSSQLKIVIEMKAKAIRSLRRVALLREYAARWRRMVDVMVEHNGCFVFFLLFEQYHTNSYAEDQNQCEKATMVDISCQYCLTGGVPIEAL